MPRHDWITTLQQHDLALSDAQREEFVQYGFLLRKWSSIAALVSSGDLEHLESLHMVDSLSLVAPLRQWVPVGGTILDIGTGGGFPAIPLAIVLRDRNFVLMERSAKKVSFLRKVMGALKLGHVRLLHGTFPDILPEQVPQAITARAVERSDEVLEDIVDLLPENCVFCCQSGDPRTKVDGDLFHVEHWEDQWTQSGARRGSLYAIRRK